MSSSIGPSASTVAARFQGRSEKNAGQLDIDDNGTIIEKGIDKQPPYIMGFPFPIIDPADPKAGTKSPVELLLSPLVPRQPARRDAAQLGGRQRVSNGAPTSMADFEYYDGVPPDERLPNPDNFSVRVLATTLSPADLNGTAALTWRYRDSDKRAIPTGPMFPPCAACERSAPPTDRTASSAPT